MATFIHPHSGLTVRDCVLEMQSMRRFYLGQCWVQIKAFINTPQQF